MIFSWPLPSPAPLSYILGLTYFLSLHEERGYLGACCHVCSCGVMWEWLCKNLLPPLYIWAIQSAWVSLPWSPSPTWVPIWLLLCLTLSSIFPMGPISLTLAPGSESRRKGWRGSYTLELCLTPVQLQTDSPPISTHTGLALCGYHCLLGLRWLSPTLVYSTLGYPVLSTALFRAMLCCHILWNWIYKPIQKAKIHRKKIVRHTSNQRNVN